MLCREFIKETGKILVTDESSILDTDSYMDKTLLTQKSN